MSQQEPGGHNERSTVPASNRHRQEDQTHRKHAESKRPETRSGARHVHFETPQIHGDHSENRRVREEPRDTHTHREDKRRQDSDPPSGMSKSQDQMARHTNRERLREDFQRLVAVRHLKDTIGIAEIAHDSDSSPDLEIMRRYREEQVRRYLLAARHGAASRERQKPGLLQGSTSLPTAHKSGGRLPRKAIRLAILQGKRSNEIQEESMLLPRNEGLSSILPKAMDRGHDILIKLWDEVEQTEAVMLRYAEANQRRKEESAQNASQLQEILATTISQSARTK